MDVRQLKEYIFENNKIEIILQEIGCHSVKYHSSGYWTCGNYNGDNKQAITVKNNEHLSCINYTRKISNNEQTDLLSLISFNKQLSFFESLKWVCEILGIDYYHDFEEEMPESLKITKLIYSLQQNNSDIDEDKPIKPISEKILTYYKPYLNDMFLKDGISYETQIEFEIGYDEYSNRITIPIRDEISSLVGVKGRLFKEEILKDELKYLYIEPCARNKILYGLHKTYPFIKQEGKCIIGEAEKSTMQLWSMDYCNGVGSGGTKVTNQQIEKLTRLGVDLIFAFDKGITKKEIEDIANRFVSGVNIFSIYDEENILNDKQSPMDNKEKWEYLYKKHLYKIK
jgi:DNA primase